MRLLKPDALPPPHLHARTSLASLRACSKSGCSYFLATWHVAFHASTLAGEAVIEPIAGRKAEDRDGL